MNMKTTAFIACLAFGTAALGVAAQQMKPEAQIKQRQAGYRVLGYNFGSLDAMVEGKKPYNKDEAVRNANLAAAIADYPRNFFGEGTDKGETKAKPEIWQKRSDFDAKMDKMITAVKALPQAAGDPAALKKAVDDAGSACKACHDDYRAK
jgi:cytochrome c556